MMADQDWVMAGVYLLGLVSIALVMSALSARATHKQRAVPVQVRVIDPQTAHG
ncbi:MAG TPA: hypothetical protein VFE79_17230 [Paraburkholderia sp.]|jgi:hypothetical protein|nr:hypothetical protein [Paraburkholderia sp.]